MKTLFYKGIKKVYYGVEAFFFLIFYGFFALLPMRWASFLGGKIFSFIGPKTRLQQRCLTNLRRAFPEKTDRDLSGIAFDMWDNLGRTVGEFPHIHTLIRKKGVLELEGVHLIDMLKNDGMPGFFFSAHLANWEISSLVALSRGLPLLLIYRAANNPYVNFIVQRHRTKAPLVSYTPKGKESAREALKVLRQGGHVGMLVDQKMGNGLPLSFFNQEAWTAPALAQLALKFKAPIVPAHVIRLKGVHFKIIYEEPFFVTETGNSEHDIKIAMIKVNKILERKRLLLHNILS